MKNGIRNILVTGADGFIGSNLVSALLLEIDCEVYATVYPSNNIYNESDSPHLHVIELDLSCIDIKCLSLFPDVIDVMYHLAWVGVRPEDRDNLTVQGINIKIAFECMKLMDGLNIKKFIVPGSTNEYLYYGMPINANAIPSPSNAYGATKIAVRYLFEIFSQKRNVIFLYAIVSGIYAADRRDSNVIFYVIDCLLKKEKPILSSLNQLWDYVYIDDVIDAFIKLGNECEKQGVYAIGHGDNMPLKNYIKIIHEIIDSSLPLGIGEKKLENGKLPCSCVDISDIRRETSFVPKISFEEGINMVIATIKKEYEI